MQLYHHSLRAGDNLDLNQFSEGDFHVLHARGRGVQVDVPNGWISVLWPLDGKLSLSTVACQWTLCSRHMQVWRDTVLRCRALGPQTWVAISASASAWESPWASRDTLQPALLPWHGRVRRETSGLFARLLRATHGDKRLPASGWETILAALWSALASEQEEAQALLTRCNGRSSIRRRQTLLRLMRVRHAIECNIENRLDLVQLSGLANYSSGHLIRTYRSVFGETPHEYAARLREQRAWEMVNRTGLPICEITGMLGFESQSAFCRAFKNSFGRTITEVRRFRPSESQHTAPQAS